MISLPATVLSATPRLPCGVGEPLEQQTPIKLGSFVSLAIPSHISAGGEYFSGPAPVLAEPQRSTGPKGSPLTGCVEARESTNYMSPIQGTLAAGPDSFPGGSSPAHLLNLLTQAGYPSGSDL